MSYFGAMGAMSKCWKCLVCRFDFVSAWDQFLKLVLVLKRLCPSKRNSIVKLMVVSWHNIFNQIGHISHLHIFTSRSSRRCLAMLFDQSVSVEAKCIWKCLALNRSVDFCRIAHMLYHRTASCCDLKPGMLRRRDRYIKKNSAT